MHADHLIAQCCWQSELDQPAKADALQDFLSRWSNTVLNDELARFFDRLCPQRVTWRIDALNLDLGEIALDELAQELPRRLRSCLQQAMETMLAEQPSRGVGSGLQILSQAATLQEILAAFLQHGSMPWWLSGNASALDVLDSQLEEAPQATIALIRDLGRVEAVRQRLVWQAGEARVRRIIGLMEPAHGKFICAYADNVLTVLAQHPVLSAARSRHPV